MHDQGQRPGGTRLSWVGRSARTVLAAARYWVDLQRRARESKSVSWPAKGWDRTVPDPEGRGATWRVRELAHSLELVEEGAAQRHCVAGYVTACASGSRAIFQMLRGQERVLTIDVDVPTGSIVQARGRFNAAPDGLAKMVLHTWAELCGLQVASC